MFSKYSDRKIQAWHRIFVSHGLYGSIEHVQFGLHQTIEEDIRKEITKPGIVLWNIIRSLELLIYYTNHPIRTFPIVNFFPYF